MQILYNSGKRKRHSLANIRDTYSYIRFCTPLQLLAPFCSVRFATVSLWLCPPVFCSFIGGVVLPLSLGFDTLIVDNRQYSDDDLFSLFELFASFDVKKFIFLCRFDFTYDSFTVAADKISRFTRRLESVASNLPTGIRYAVKYELQIDKGVSENPELHKLCASRSKRSIFVSLPMFLHTADNNYATDINRLLYRSELFPIFTSAHNFLETAPDDFASRFLSTGAGFAFDINYLLRADAPKLIENIISKNILISPMISRDIPNYIGIESQVSYFRDIFGKNTYYKLCTQINRCLTRAGL